VNKKNTDSIYALMGDGFKKQLPYGNLKAVLQNQIGPLLPFIISALNKAMQA
jgi:hypothetical protein